MEEKRPITLKIFLFLVSTDILETAAQFCFKKTSLAQATFVLHQPLDIPHFIFQAAANPYLWSGLIAVFALFCIWSTILSRVDLSVAVPVASFSYIVIPTVSVIFLGEYIPPLRWAGIGVILLGVILVSISSHYQQTG